jgi:hypothetical protein
MDDFENIINEIFDKINLNEEKKILKVTKKQIIDVYNNNIKNKNQHNNDSKNLKKNNKKKIENNLPKIKKPKNPYMIFCDENRKNIKEDNPDITFGEISKLLSEKWKNTDEEKRKIYAEKSEKDKERYNLEIKKIEGKN